MVGICDRAGESDSAMMRNEDEMHPPSDVAISQA